MNPDYQLNVLDNIENFESFQERLNATECYPLMSDAIEILQINIGKKCNLRCRHCHVEASPSRTELMSRRIMEKCIETIQENSGINTIDITGGAPEMNPNLEWFIKESAKLNKRLIVRSNLVILLEDEYKKYIDIYADNISEVVGSLPDYNKDKSERQRGEGSYSKTIEVLRLLNERGYGGKDSGLVLNLVHNPVGAYLPGSQLSLEVEYKMRLKKEYNIEFNNLYVMTNMPIGRYLDYLMKSDNFNDYLNDLNLNYNLEAVSKVMCRNTISVGFDGKLYDCDFNQMLGLNLSLYQGDHIENFDYEKLSIRKININNHCYGCTAGAGSSCQGAIE